uniref:uncharacterized protein n=1 Tax=Semicossyphus pulcher TaxID=241346 RepID=UPI0037E97926
MTSGSTCAVSGCHNNSKKVKTFLASTCLKHRQLRRLCPCPVPYSLHSMPKKEERRSAWLEALSLKRPPKRIYVCSFHFVEKRPTKLHPDPELYLGDDQPRWKGLKLTRVRKTRVDNCSKEGGKNGLNSAVDHESSSSHFPVFPSKNKELSTGVVDHDHSYYRLVQDKATQCDEIGYFMLQNDSDALLYTGIGLEVFHVLVESLETHDRRLFTMSVHDQVLMTLMKLKTNRETADLSRTFRVSQFTASSIISYWIEKLEQVLQSLILWLPKEAIQTTMPEAFKKNFPNTTCLVDVCVSRVENPLILSAGGESCSMFSLNKTMKYLVAVAPCGLFMFISAAYREHYGDKFITTDSGILDHLKPGDEVMVNRDLHIKNWELEKQIRVVTPPSTETKTTDEQETCAGRVRIHVRRAIKRLKVYKILSQVVPISLAPQMNKIVRICAALVNLRGDLTHDWN